MIAVHVHLREPGQTWKEDFESGTEAALAGGITMVCVMPNTNPTINSIERFEATRQIAMSKAKCDFGLFVIAEPSNAHEWASVDHRIAPVAMKIYLGPTFINSTMTNMISLIDHLEKWPRHLPVCVHAEGLTGARILLLAKLSSRPLHICHVSRQEEVVMIRKAKESGFDVTCEVCPHHLFLSSEDVSRIGETL